MWIELVFNDNTLTWHKSAAERLWAPRPPQLSFHRRSSPPRMQNLHSARLLAARLEVRHSKGLPDSQGGMRDSEGPAGGVRGPSPAPAV